MSVVLYEGVGSLELDGGWTYKPRKQGGVPGWWWDVDISLCVCVCVCVGGIQCVSRAYVSA